MFEHPIFNPFVLVSFAIPHTLFTVLFLFTKENGKLHDKIASIWMLLTVIPILLRIILPPDIFITTIHRNITYPLLYGPMAYFYTISLTRENPILDRKILYHFIPVCLIGVILYLLPPELNPNQVRQNPLPPRDVPPPFLKTAFILDGIILISVSSYSILCLKVLREHSISVKQYFSNITETRSLNWLKWTIYIFALIFVFNAITPVIFKFLMHSTDQILIPPHQFKILHSSIFVLFTYILSFFTIRQSIIYPTIEKEILLDKKTLNNTKEEKYIRSGLKKEEAEQIAKKLLDYMKKEKPYLREDLRIREVADEINVNLNHLSQALNEVIQKNFYNFVNEYRIEEVKTRLTLAEYKDYPLIRIALDCGFNSKSSFNSVFKRITSISPKEFRKSQILIQDTRENI